MIFEPTMIDMLATMSPQGLIAHVRAVHERLTAQAQKLTSAQVCLTWCLAKGLADYDAATRYPVPKIDTSLGPVPARLVPCGGELGGHATIELVNVVRS